MRRKIIAGNWKMNGSLASINELVAGIKAGADSLDKSTIVVCPSAIYLPLVSELVKGTNIKFGAQDLSEAQSGAYTGEMSGSMLNDFACDYVIVGHSERRNMRGESDALVAAKFKAAQEAGLTPILCVGELLEEREAGITDEVVARQIDAVIDLSGIDSLANAVVAYEPVWAIGTGKTATCEQAQAAHKQIRDKIRAQNASIADNLQIQYGGSMNAGNAKELLGMSDIDGGLIGGASLTARDFLAICQAAEDLS